MKAKTRKTLERTVIIMLVLVFGLGTFLLYLPTPTTTPAATPPAETTDAAQSQEATGATVQTAVPGP